MIKAFFFCLFIAGVGALAIYRGKQAIKNKFMANSRKSSRWTGVTHMEGEAAVRAGKANIVLGWILLVGGLAAASVVMLLGVASMFMDTSVDQTSSGSWSDDDPSGSSFVDRNARNERQKPGRMSRGAFSDRGTFGNRSSRNRPSSDRSSRNDSSAPSSDPDSDPFEDPSSDSTDDDSSTGSSFLDDIEPPDPTADDFEEKVDELMERAKEEMDRIHSNPPRTRRGAGRDGKTFGSRSGRSGFGDDASDKADSTSLPALEAPFVAFPETSYDKTRTKKSNLVGFALEDRTVEDEQDPDKILVGLNIGMEEGMSKRVMNVQGIYQRGDQYILGKTLGKEGGSKTRLLAPAGFAVSGVQVESGVRITALRLAFMKPGTNGRLDAKTQTVSDWIGDAKGQSRDDDTVDGRGDPIVSVLGGIQNGKLVSIGLVAVKRLKVSSTNDDGGSTGLRTWESADGKYQVRAQYVSHTDDDVELRKPDGEVITVKIRQLGKDEQKWLSEQK